MIEIRKKKIFEKIDSDPLHKSCRQTFKAIVPADFPFASAFISIEALPGMLFSRFWYPCGIKL